MTQNMLTTGITTTITGAEFNGTSFVAGMLASGVTAGLGSILPSGLNEAQQKYLGGALSLGASAGGELAKYGVYAASNLAQGHGWDSFGKAYDDMGGLTLNVMNVGALFDFAVSGMARLNKTGQLAGSESGIAMMGRLRDGLSGTGILEVNIGSKGVSSQFGMGGIDVGGAVYDLAKRGLDYARMQSITDQQTRETAIQNYGWGDWTAENTSMRITSGLDELVFSNEAGFMGLTVSNGKGGRTITIQGSGDVNLDAIRLQHESHRDGVVTAGNAQETQRATLAHTQMAERMRNDKNYDFTDVAITAMDSFFYGMALANGDMGIWENYVTGMYDSTDSNWLLTHDGQLINDGKGWLTMVNGEKVLNANGEQIGAGGTAVETGLLNIIFGGTSGVAYDDYSNAQIEFVQDLMKKAGMSYTGDDDDRRSWEWDKSTAGERLDMGRIMKEAGDTVAGPVFAQYYRETINTYMFGIGITVILIPSLPTMVDHNAFSRFYNELLPTMVDNYKSMQSFVGPDFQISQAHNKNDVEYENYPAHFGTDWANGKSGDPIYMGISGRVIGSYNNDSNNGYWSTVEYGFLFEGAFVGSGIYGEYMHMQNKSTHNSGTYLTGSQIVGNVGDTGASFNSKGERVPHFHHTIYTLQYTSPEYNGFSDTTLRMLFNNNIGNTVNSREAKPYIGTNGNSATKVTYNIENYLNRLKK